LINHLFNFFTSQSILFFCHCFLRIWFCQSGFNSWSYNWATQMSSDFLLLKTFLKLFSPIFCLRLIISWKEKSFVLAGIVAYFSSSFSSSAIGCSRFMISGWSCILIHCWQSSLIFCYSSLWTVHSFLNCSSLYLSMSN
jgi:hypothetical protein